MIKSEAPTRQEEEVVIIYIQEYLERELSEVEKKIIYKHGGFVNVEKGIIILPWTGNPELKMNKKQADTLEVVDKMEKMPFTPGGYIARVQYE